MKAGKIQNYSICYSFNRLPRSEIIKNFRNKNVQKLIDKFLNLKCVISDIFGLGVLLQNVRTRTFQF